MAPFLVGLLCSNPTRLSFGFHCDLNKLLQKFPLSMVYD